MSVLRWKLNDPYDTDTTTNTWTFPRNPSSMTSPFAARAVTSMRTTAGKLLTYEGASPAQQWQFSGPILHKGEIDTLYNWVYNRKRRVQLVDHFGRTITLVFTGLEITPKRRTGYYWSHDYTCSALIISVSTPTVTDVGPRP